MQCLQPDGNLRALNSLRCMEWLHTHATVLCSSIEVTCQPFPSIRGLGIRSGVSHHKSYTVIVGGSMSPKAFRVRIGLLVCCKIGWRQLDFFLGHIHLQEDTGKRVNTFK